MSRLTGLNRASSVASQLRVNSGTMFSLHLTCNPQEVDLLSAELWEAGTAGIREIEEESEVVKLIAGFGEQRDDLTENFLPYFPRWVREAETDWVDATHYAWPGRSIGCKLFLAAPWCEAITPSGRMRLIHNPGMAAGTGEHPCTQLALEALEGTITTGSTVADIGTGSGILAIAAHLLGGAFAIGVDLDESALNTARENFALNHLQLDLVAGSAECLRSESFSVVVANISATVLLSIADELLRVLKPGGTFILTGFPDGERAAIEGIFPAQAVLEKDGWSCLISNSSLPA